MKIKIAYITTALLLNILLSNAQVRPFLVDLPSNTGSGLITLEYNDIIAVEKDIQKELDRFLTEYGQRAIYIVSSQSLVDNVKTEVQEALNRYTSLNKRNESLSSIFSYSTKKDNQKKMNAILNMLQNVNNEMRGQSGLDIVYGEKLNLYQNVTYSLLDIHRLMDTVEDAIEKTSLANRILN